MYRPYNFAIAKQTVFGASKNGYGISANV